jgi:hypothetical protein
MIRIQRVNRIRAPWLQRIGTEVTKLERVVKAAPGLMEIAEIAMPDTYFQSDSRVCEMREALKEAEDLLEGLKGEN